MSYLHGSLITVLSEHFEDPFDIYRAAGLWFIIQRRSIQFLFCKELNHCNGFNSLKQFYINKYKYANIKTSRIFIFFH